MADETQANEHTARVGVDEKTVHIPFPESFAYANCAAFSISHMDIRIGFAEAMPDGRAIPKAGIVMPPESAAVIALILLQQVQAYENSFGEIRHPAWKKAKAKLASAKLASATDPVDQ